MTKEDNDWREYDSYDEAFMLCYDIVNLGFFYFKENVTSAYLI
jgi:hypothetical protein